jgi:hypothetical protein
MDGGQFSLKDSDPPSGLLLKEHMPGKSFAEYASLGVVIGLTINGFVLLITYGQFRSGAVLLPAGLHLAACTTVALLFLWGWPLNHLGQTLIVHHEHMEYTAGGHTKTIARQGTVVRMSLIRSSHGSSNRVVIESKEQTGISLPEELTGSPERFLNLLEAHGWLVVRPPGWEGRLY